MGPYNVKVITYPDLTRQIRIYHRIVEYRPRTESREQNPFDGNWTWDIKGDIKEHYEHVSEVSLKRTKKKVYDYAKCNEWDWFVTFTFAAEKVNRYDYEECAKKLSKWLNNLKQVNRNMQYVVVPERHKDGAWHFHGVFAGLEESEVKWTGRNVVKRVKSGNRSRFVKTKEKIYKIGRYRLGWMTATRVRKRERVTSYITKYLTKDMLAGLYGKKRYWASRGLLVPTEEVFTLDATGRFILSTELDEDASYKTVAEACYGDMTQYVKIFELS